MSFGTIPTRANGQDVDASWWNLLKDAGVALETIVGGGSIKTITNADSPYPVVPASDFDLVVDTTGGAVVIVAPGAAGNSGYAFRVKNKFGNPPLNTVTVNFADDVDGQPTATIPVNNAVEFKNDGTTYYAY